jgi:hypothetical protein
VKDRQSRILILGMLLATVTIAGVFFVGLWWLARRLGTTERSVLGQGNKLGADAAGRELEQTLMFDDIRKMAADLQKGFARIERGQTGLTEIFNRVERLDPRNGRD